MNISLTINATLDEFLSMDSDDVAKFHHQTASLGVIVNTPSGTIPTPRQPREENADKRTARLASEHAQATGRKLGRNMLADLGFADNKEAYLDAWEEAGKPPHLIDATGEEWQGGGSNDDPGDNVPPDEPFTGNAFE